MAGGRVYGSSNMRILLQNRGIPCPAQSLEALLASSSSPTTLHDSRTIVNFEGVRRKTPDFSFYRSFDLEELGEDDLDDGFHHPEKKRRLTADQVQFLEKSFEVENKLEPERKIQLAKDLGLQPRQVAIWFQNRRARWKTKQLEKDFEKLKTCYNSLKADYEVILKEKDKLKEEVLNLTDKLLKEKIREDSETSEHDIRKPHPVMSDDELAEVSNSATKLLHTPLVVCKQEALSSANSVVFDSDSPHYTDGGHSSLFDPANSSNIFVPDRMDLSPTEEEQENNLSKTLFSLANHFPKTEEDRDYAADPPANSCKYGFPVEDQAFWSWQY